MSSRLKENFLRHAILVVDHSKDALISLVDLDLLNNGSSFEQFINNNQHEIYHLHNSSRCCQCPNGYNPPRTARILHFQQMDLLFEGTLKKPCHKPGRSADYCCSPARPGLRTDILDLTLARCLLINFCLDVFWYSCLNQQGKTLEDFLNNHKHDIYHLWQYSTPCCQCPVSGYSFPNSRPILDQTNWIQMFNALKLPCLNHKKRPSPGSMYSICSVAAMSGITVTHLDSYVSKVVLQNCCSLMQAIEKLVQIRNEDFGHATSGEMTDKEYYRSVTNIENCIMEIARFCNKEKPFQAKQGTLQYMLYEKYKNCLTEYVAHQDKMNKGLAEILPKLDKLGGKIASKAERLPAVIAAKVPKIMEQTVQQFQETLKQRCTDHEQLLDKFSNYFDKLKYQTNLEIRCHWSEGTFVETNAVRKCMKNIEKYDVFIIFGSEGMGKSRIGLEILRQIGEKDSHYDLVKISYSKQVKNVIIDNGKLALCLDDLFSATFCHCENVIGYHIFDLLHARKSEGNTKIIFTVQSLQRKIFNNLFASHRLFQGCYEIDLNRSKFRMTDAEKEELLSKFCTKQKIKVEWSINNDTDDRALDKRTFYQIVRTEPYIGFPKACFLFSSQKCVFQLGLRFFTHANKSLIEKIVSLRDGSDVQDIISYAILVYLLLYGDCISINEIDVQKVTAIMKLCGNVERCALKHLIAKGLHNIEGKYVVYDKLDLKYQYSHHMVHEAVAISYFDVDPSSVVSVLTLNFISEIIRLQSKDLKEEEEPTLILPQYMYGNLAKQMLKIFDREFKAKPFEFVKLLCETNILLQDDENFVNVLLKEFSQCTKIDKLELRYQKRCVKVIFHFPAALLHYMSRGERVVNTMAAAIYSLEEVVKNKENTKIYDTCSNILLTTFSHLFEHDEVDIIFLQLLETIEECKIECDLNTFMHGAIENGYNSTGSYVLKQLSNKINIVELVMTVADKNLSNLYSIVCNSFNIAINSCTDRVEITHLLLKNTPKNTFNLNSVLMAAISYKIESVLKWLLKTFTNLKFDTNILIKGAFKNSWNDVLILLLKVDNIETNFLNFIFCEACNRGCLIIVNHAIRDVDHNVFDMKTAMKNACGYDQPDIVKYLIENVDPTLFNMNAVMQKACLCGWLAIVKYLIENVDHTQFDMKTAINTACRYGKLNTVKHLIDNVDNALFTMKTAMNTACRFGWLDTVKYLIKDVDNALFDMKTLMNTACLFGWLDTVKYITENVGYAPFNMKTAINTACRYGKINIVKFMIENVDHDLFDMKTAMNTACRFGWLDILKYLIKNVDNELFDLKTAMNAACGKEAHMGIVKHLIENVDIALFDMKALMKTACLFGKQDIVNYLIKNVDNPRFAMKTAMNTACRYGWLNIVKYLMENVDNTLFDWKTLMNTACLFGKLDIVKYLIENDGHTNFDMKTVMNEVCQYGKLDIVKHLIENIAHTLFDMKTAMQKACGYTHPDIVKYFIENFDFKLFDREALVKTGIQNRWLDSVKYLIENDDHSNININAVMQTACRCEWLDLVKYLIENVGHTNFDMKTAMKKACGNTQPDIVKYFIENFDLKLFDGEALVKTVLQNRWLDSVKYLIENDDHSHINMNAVMQTACRCGWFDLVKYLIENVGHTSFDMKTVMNEVCQYGKLDIVKHLIENIAHILFDMKTAMKKACGYAHPDIVKYLIENVDLKLFDMGALVKTVFHNRWLDSVEYLIENDDHSHINMNAVMQTACMRGWLDIVKCLIDNVDLKLLDMKTVMQTVCQYGTLDIVKYLIKNVGHTNFDMKTVMNDVCQYGKLDIVKHLIENVDNALFDIKKAIDKACRYGKLNIVKKLIENGDNALFDMKTAMNTACRYGWLNIVKYLIENVDNALFDMKTAMDAACEKEANIDIVKHLIENVDYELFDMKTTMNTACQYGTLDIVKYLIENVDHKIFDMKTVMNEACQYGSLDVVKYFMESFNRACFYMDTAVNIDCEGADLSLLQYFYEYRHCVTEKIQKLIDSTFNSIVDNEIGDSEAIIKLFCETKNGHIDWSDVFSQACGVGFYEVADWLLNNISHATLDLNTSVLRALHLKNEFACEIVTLILQNCDHTLMDMKTVIYAICHRGFTEIAKEALIDKKISTFDPKAIMNEACLHGDLNLVKWLWESEDNSMFDMKTAMLKVCRSRGKDSISVLKWLWENINRDIFDMNVGMDNACAYGRTETVKWILSKTNAGIFQIQNALLRACENGHVSTVEWLTTKIPAHMLDLPWALQTTCSSSKCSSANIVEVLAKQADKSKLNINSLIGTACKCCKTDIVRYLINCTEINTIDYKKALNAVLSIDINQDQNKKPVYQGKRDLVLLILQKADPSNINIESAIIEACKHDWIDIMEHIWLNISHSYFEINAAKIEIACEHGSGNIIQWSLDAIALECIDINTLMIESCGYGWMNIVKRLWNREEINHDKFDMKTAMNDACTYNRLEIVSWLLQNTDDQTFDMNYVLIESCRNGWINIVKNITKNGDSTFNNITVTSGITEACTNSHLPVVEFMYQTFGTELFDLEKISERRTIASENEDVTMFFLRNFYCNSFDIPTVLKRACSFGWSRVVKWIVEELEYHGDLAEPFNNGCVNGECEIVKYLLQKLPQEKLDIKSAMLSACSKGWDDIVALLLQKVDHQNLNLRDAAIGACRCEDSNSVVLIIRRVDHKLIDLNAVLIEICMHSAREQLVFSILKTVDSSEFDRNIVMEKAKKHNWRKVLLFLNSKKG